MLDPQIALAGTRVTPTDPNEEAIKAGQASDALALARQRIQSRQDDAAFSTAMQQSGGDPDKAIALLQTTNPRAALTYGTAITKQRQDNLKLAADQSDFLGKQTDAALKLFQGVGNDPKQYQIALRGAFGILHDTPVGDQLAALPQNPTPDQIPGLVDGILQKGMEAKAYHEQVTQGLKTWLGNDPVAGIAHMLEVTPDPQARADILKFAKVHGAPDEFITAATALNNQVTAGADPKATFSKLLPDQKPIEVPQGGTLIDPVTHQPVYESAGKGEQKDYLVNGVPTVGIFDPAKRTVTDLKGNDITAVAKPMPPASVQLAGAIDPNAVSKWVDQLRNPSSGITLAMVPSGLRTAVIEKLEPGEVTKLTAASQSMKELATSLEPQIQKVSDLAKQINDQGFMGTTGGRWRDILSKEGAADSIAGLTPAQKRLVGQFVTQAGLLKSGIARAHGGARGGGSIQMLESLSPILDPANKDLDVYLGNLIGAKDVIHGYAHMGESDIGGGASAKDPMGIRKGGG